jgi:hypothetical protein
VKRGRPLKSVEGLALRVHRILRESGPRNLNIVRAMCKIGAQELGNQLPTAHRIIFERVVGILFLQGVVEWKSSGRHRRLAARSEA